MHTLTDRLIRYMARISAVVIMLVPFHAFLTVWLSSFLGQYTLLRLWKEFLLLLLICAAIYVVVRKKQLQQGLVRDRLFWVIGAYIGLLLVVGLAAFGLGQVTAKALAYGLLLDSRYLLFFTVTWLVARQDDLLVRTWKIVLLVPATVVAGFALLQHLVLPPDWLRHVGYNQATIPPIATVDQKIEFQRVQSTLRGPNPLGAYLVVVLSALGALLISAKKLFKQYGLLFAASGLALFWSYSRSAWLGTFLSIALLLITSLRSGRSRRLLLIVGAVLVLMAVVVTATLRNNDTFQNLVFHTNEHSRSIESSNAGHSNAVLAGIKDIARRPWGGGTGTAGPASVYNDRAVHIAENYYVQIGQEIGVVGLGLLLAVLVLVGQRLWLRRQNTLALVLFTSLIGISIINLLSHAWTDDTLAYLWWGFAGAMLGQANEKVAQNNG